MIRSFATSSQSGFPLVLVDEYQDTNDEQDELIDLLASAGQTVYLGDPEQRIYDPIPGVRADRFDRLVARGRVSRIDLPVTCHRSGQSDLVSYGRAVLAGRSLSSKPRDVSVWRYGRAADFSKKLRQAIMVAEKAVTARSAGKVAPPTSAVLAYTNGFAMRLSEDLRSAAPGFDHEFQRARDQLGLNPAFHFDTLRETYLNAHLWANGGRGDQK